MGKIIYPPRPKGAIPPNELPYYDGLGIYCVQPKYNGARSVIHISPEGEVKIYSRHGRAHRSYTPPAILLNEISKLPGLKNGIEYWLDGELMIKTTAEDTKGKLVLFDVIQYDKYLFLSLDQVKRLELLAEICGRPTELDCFRKMAYVISDNLLMAPTFFSNFEEKFKEDHGNEVEGLVLRKKDSVIDNFGNKEYLVNWLVRCRRPHKNYNF